MAAVLVNWSKEFGFAHCIDVYEFVAAAGNVGHEVMLVISGNAAQYLSMDYLDEATGKSTRKILSSLPLYDVEHIYLAETIEDVPDWICVDMPSPLTFDYEVCF